MADDTPYLLQPWSSRFAKPAVLDQKRYLGPPKKTSRIGRFFPDLFTGFFQLLLLGLDLIKGLVQSTKAITPRLWEERCIDVYPVSFKKTKLVSIDLTRFGDPWDFRPPPTKITGKKKVPSKNFPCLDIVCKRCQSGGTNIQGLQSRHQIQIRRWCFRNPITNHRLDGPKTLCK